VESGRDVVAASGRRQVPGSDPGRLEFFRRAEGV